MQATVYPPVFVANTITLDLSDIMNMRVACISVEHEY